MKNKRLEKHERLQIVKLYSVDKLSTIKIAKMFGCRPNAVIYWLNKNKVVCRNFNESHIGSYEFSGDYDVLYVRVRSSGASQKR